MALENRNQLTTEATARLLHSIIGGVSVSRTRSQLMMDLLAQAAPKSAMSSQSFEPSFERFPENVQRWSQSAITAEVGHSLTYLEAPGVHPYLLVVFTAPRNSPSASSRSSRAPNALLPDERMQNEALISFVSQQIFETAQKNFERPSA